jgi:hypothetical protein
MQDTGYIGFYPGSRIPNPASIGAEMAQTMINAEDSILEQDDIPFKNKSANWWGIFSKKCFAGKGRWGGRPSSGGEMSYLGWEKPSSGKLSEGSF